MVRPLDVLRVAHATRTASLHYRLSTPMSLPRTLSTSAPALTTPTRSTLSNLSGATWTRAAANLHSSARAHRAPVPNHTVPQSPLVPKSGAGYGGNGGGKKPNAYTVWYRDILPSMIPIFVMSTAIFLALSLARTHLSHARSLEESTERIVQLEAQLARLRAEAKRRQERERRERERILPLVVERVLQRVGAMGEDVDEEIEYEDRLLV